MYVVLFLDVCGYSHAAKELLDDKNLKYEIYYFSKDIENGEKKYFKTLNNSYLVGKDEDGNTVFDKKMFKDMFGKTSTFPRIYKNNEFIGGYNDLNKSLN